MDSSPDSDASAKQEKQTNVNPETVNPPVVPPSPPANHETGNREDKPEKKKRPTKHEHRRYMLLINGILAAAAIAGGVLYFQQNRQMDKTMRLDERAWVAPDQVLGIAEINKAYNVMVVMKNSGKTFARRVEIAAGAEVLPRGQKPKLERLTEPGPANRSKGIIPPNSTFHVEFIINPNITLEELTKYRSGDKVPYVYGRVSYQDIFNCDHWTTFCFVYDGISGYTPCEAEHSNDADEGACP